MNLTPTNTVTAAYEAFGRRDIPKIFALFAPDIEIIQSEELPWGGRFQGHEGARQFFSKLTAWLNSTLEIERLISSGDHVVAVGWTTGKVNASGASYRVPVAHVWKVRDGLVAQVQFFIDNPAMLAALNHEAATKEA
jgi:ketosteroid isomerase-like protein